ncbi:MAG TPA: SprT family zinc-dependent metalloprotease [Rhodocyclaceae bacterium]|nr:SprT family zinc-dependent metalloprotease [Rhodocyclaceae bacterium]HNN08849.1 SprT family zinc-dependent metalloprotease [Azospira sp.]HNN46262.1 SprT family zinc-dependent metalloprotease [Azospira sp.]
MPDAGDDAQLALPLVGVAIAAGEEPRRITLGDRIVPYLLRRGTRRTIGLSIDHRGLRVGAPRRTSLADVETLIRKHGEWVVEKLDEWRTRRRPEPLRIVDGARLAFLGDEIEIGVAIGANRAIWSAGCLTLCMKPGLAPGPVLEKALRERAREHFAARLVPLAAALGVAVPALALSSARTRWGSCSTKSGVRLNWRLIHFPEAIIDYVVVHELAHLRHMNHGPRFWSLVEVGCPDYRTARVELQRLAAHIPHW